MSKRYPDYPSLKLDFPAERVLRLTMSRGKMNSMDYDLHHDLTEIWPLIEKDDDVSVVILTGAGNVFSAGGDFELVKRLLDDWKFRTVMWKDGRNLVRNMMEFNKPVIAAINGAAAGGGLVAALMSDITIAARSAKIVDGHPRLGVAAGDVAPLVWPLLCGMAKAKYHILTGRPIDGAEAERIGLISLCVDDDKLMTTALEVAEDLLAGASSGIRWTKLAFNNWFRAAWPIFDAAMAMENMGFSGPDAREGVSSHLERRKPQFDKDTPV